MIQLGSLKRCAVFVAVIAGIYVLHWASDILVPLVIAILLADLLAPVVRLLVRHRVPNAAAVLLVTGAIAGIALIVILLMSQQLIGLSNQLPNYRDNILTKMRALRVPGPITRLTDMADSLSREFQGTGSAKPGTPTSATRPVEVEVVTSQTQKMSTATGLLHPIFSPLVDAGIVFIYLFFLLLERDLIGHRLRWLLRHGEVGIKQTVIEEASRRVGRYLRMQFAVNVAYGVLMFAVFWLFGLPNSLLLALLAAILRYVPYIGPLVAISLPTLLGVAIFPGWGRPLGMLGAMVAVELTVGGFLEPLLYSSSTGVSSVGVVLSYFFWSWVWGPVGLILATPITAWVVIVGRHLTAMRPLSVLLSGDSIENIEAEDSRDKPQIEPKEEGWAE